MLRVSLTRSVDDTARQGAAGVMALIDANRLPDPVPVGPDVTIQVLNAAGRITDVSQYTDRLVPLLTPAQAAATADSGGAVLLNGPAFGMPSLLRVTAMRASGGYVVIAAVPYSSVTGSLSVVAKALAFGTPLLLVLFTGAGWLAVGSTLRPIALLRRGAARVTATGVPSDLPVPEARDEVRSLVLTLNDMLSRLATAQQRQRALVSDTAHELRSPIASIRAQLEVALDHPSGQDWASTARDVHADVLRLARLAEDLLLLARLDERAGAPRRGATVDLAALSASVVARYAGARVPVVFGEPGETPTEAANAPGAAAGADAVNAPGNAGAALAAAAGPAGPAGEAGGAGGTGGTDGDARAAAPFGVADDEDSLDRLLVNLVDNAVRYAESRVEVTVCRLDGRVMLTVADDGPGIPADGLGRAFDRFARLDDARSRDGDEGGGAGLGLAIVRATAQAYGGTAHLEPAARDADPPGLRAVVSLPAAD